MLSQLGSFAKNIAPVKSSRNSFINKHTFEDRKTESARILLKYPDRIPIIVEKSTGAIDLPTIDRNKYLVPCDLSMGQFIFVIRKRIKLQPSAALFTFVGNGVQPVGTEMISSIYEHHKSKDGYLYVKYAAENTFG